MAALRYTSFPSLIGFTSGLTAIISYRAKRYVSPQKSVESCNGCLTCQGATLEGYPESLSKVPETSQAIPDGTNAPVSMFSARFNGEMEKKFREVHQLLLRHNFENRMVDASGADDYGSLTVQCLGELFEKNGVMIAVCTPDYGEKTSSPYSSNRELLFAFDEELRVLPLKVCETYPPKPPGGPEHAFDKKGEARTMCRMVFKRSLVYLDCQNKSVQEITAMIANALVKM